MTESERKNFRLKFLQQLKRKGKSVQEFGVSLSAFQEEATSRGLEDDEIEQIADIIVNVDLGSTKLVPLVKCLIPVYRISDKLLRNMIIWLLGSLNDMPITLSATLIQWIIGLWNYQLVDIKTINIFYDPFFYNLLKKEKLEKTIACLIYVLTKPEDVTRRNVCRLLNLQQKYSKPQKHIIALLSLFKCYKPELVPEKIQAVNIESIWKPIPEVLRLGFANARDRTEVQQTSDKTQDCFKWYIAKPKKPNEVLLPSIGYFQIGSSIFRDKNAKSIFDVNNTEDLGRYQFNIELPCNILSLLANSAGYHLLTYADLQYQSRFSYNLYNSLRKAFILESDKFSQEEKNKLLDMTIEFSQYMQQGVMVVNLFIDEYLFLNSDEHRLKIFFLLQWMTCVSAPELQEKIFVHLKQMFYELPLKMKCELIKCFRNWAVNLFVNQGYEECFRNIPAPFLGQGPIDSLQEIFPLFTRVVGDLIVSGLNSHAYDVLLLSESIAFYEQIAVLEARSNIFSWTLTPSAVIFGGFVSKSSAILSRICELLLSYRRINSRFIEHGVQGKHIGKINIVSAYAVDLLRCLWFNEAFSKQNDGYFLKNFPTEVVDNLADLDMDSLLSVKNHLAFLPYRYALHETGWSIKTREDAIDVAVQYYPAVKDFITVFYE